VPTYVDSRNDPDVPNSNIAGYGNVTQNANVMVAQLTIPTGSVEVAIVNLQGRLVGGNATYLVPDYQVHGLHFTLGSVGTIDQYTCTCQPGFANGVCGYGSIANYTSQCNNHASASCDVDVDECMSNPCARDSTACVAAGGNANGCRCTESSANSSVAVDSFSCIPLPAPPAPPFASTYTIDVYASTAAPLVVGTTNFSVAGYTTYRLRKPLGPSQLNVYAMFGHADNVPHVPPAWFAPSATSVTSPPTWSQVTGAGSALAQAQLMYQMCLGPQAAMCGPGTAMWPNTNATYQLALLATTTQPLALTSFLSLGPDTSSVPSPAMGMTGTAITGWQSGAALTLGVNPSNTTDFGFFWMDPTAPTGFQAANGVFVGGPLIAQLTLPSDQAWFVRLGLQGESTGGAAHWQEDNAVWVHRSPSGACPAGMSGTGCLTDVDECASNPCANVAGSTSCWHGVDEYACICGATVCGSTGGR
jgi:hypothetical protein